jgi:hypothetical protein
LNQDGYGFDGRAGDAYSPPAYSAVELPSFCLAIRRILFGSRPDWLMRNYRAHQLMLMLHTTELAQHVLDLDPRVTYNTDGSTNPFSSIFPFQRNNRGQVVATPLDDTTAGFYPTSELDEPDATGQCYRQWLVEVADGSSVRATHETSPRTLEILPYTITQGLSNLLQLPRSSIKFRFDESVGSKWSVAAYLKPQWGIGELEAAIDSMTEDVMLELFHVGDQEAKQEPWQTFRNLWHDHPEAPYRVGGVVLALIYHTHNIWSLN